MITFWLSYEFISLNVNIISPWLNLGNGLSKDILFIQWYEVTGTAGGSLWILCFQSFSYYYSGKFPHKEERRNSLYLIIWLSVIIIPSVISVYRYFTIKQNRVNGSEVVIIQPDTDPYTEKFTIPFVDQLKKCYHSGKYRNYE